MTKKDTETFNRKQELIWTGLLHIALKVLSDDEMEALRAELEGINLKYDTAKLSSKGAS